MLQEVHEFRTLLNIPSSKKGRHYASNPSRLDQERENRGAEIGTGWDHQSEVLDRIRLGSATRSENKALLEGARQATQEKVSKALRADAINIDAKLTEVAY